MGDYPYEDMGMVAGISCGTGALWSWLAGDVDLSTAEGWGQVGQGCLASAVTGTTLHAVSYYSADEDADIALDVVTAWWALQGAASTTNIIGHHFDLEQDPAYQAFAFPLNYSATPILSTGGLLYGLIAAAADDDITADDFFFYGGMLVINHEASLAAFNTGAVGHSFSADQTRTGKHEMGHQVQASAVGGLGFGSLILMDGLITLMSGCVGCVLLGGPGGHTIEPWARDYEKHYQDNNSPLKEDPDVAKEIDAAVLNEQCPVDH